MLNYSSFSFSAAVTGLFTEHSEVVIASSPQLLVGMSGWWIARWKRVPFVFEVRDLWPESLAAVGAGSENSLLHRSLGAVASFLYRKSSHIVVVTPAFKDHLVQHWQLPPSRISVIENGVEAELFSPGQTGDEIRRSLDLEGKFVVCYIGTMGMAHGLDTLIDAATTLQSTRPDILFLLVGEGSDKERIQALANTRGLPNLRFVDQQPRATIPSFIAASDVCVVMLKKTDLFKTVIPTKMLEFMSCARPVILGVEGQARKILAEARAGIAIEPESVASLAQAVVDLAGDPSGRRVMGDNGRKYILEHCSRDRSASDYITVLESMLRRAPALSTGER
jgi:glycosyltransferase involved in cell wall biosynthesis